MYIFIVCKLYSIRFAVVEKHPEKCFKVVGNKELSVLDLSPLKFLASNKCFDHSNTSDSNKI